MVWNSLILVASDEHIAYWIFDELKEILQNEVNEKDIENHYCPQSSNMAWGGGNPSSRLSVFFSATKIFTKKFLCLNSFPLFLHFSVNTNLTQELKYIIPLDFPSPRIGEAWLQVLPYYNVPNSYHLQSHHVLNAGSAYLSLYVFLS